MNITAYFASSGVPAIGLSPIINIRDLSDNSLIVTGAAMSEVGDGFYKYTFTGYDTTKNYTIRCDGGVGLLAADRYSIATTGQDGEVSLIKIKTDYLPNAMAGTANGLPTTNGTKINQTVDLTSGQKIAATLAPADCSGNLPAQVKAQDDIDFGALQKASLNAATPAASNMRGTDNAITSLSGVSTFDPATQSVVAANMRGTDDAALAVVCTETRLAQLEATALPADIADILVDTGTTLDGKINAIKAKTDTLGGAGAITWPYTVTDSVTGGPIDGVEVWVTTDSAGTNVIANGTTDENGIVTFYLDAGTVFAWRKRAGYNFENPDQEVVS